MKTVEEWAQELPEDVRDKFLANVVEQRGKNYLKHKIKTLSDVIIHSFVWFVTPEKDNFWRNIHKQLKSENR